MSELALNLDGYTDIPDDKIAFVVTHLEMPSAPEVPLSKDRDDLALVSWEKPGLEEYRDLFRQVGGDWMWFSRLTKSDDELSAILSEPDRENFLPMRDGKPLGTLELNFADPENAEVAYFGLIPEAIGGGVGRWLMNEAVQMAWARPETKRVWLHTCTGDSPQALGFYMSCGYRPFKRCIEVVDDPRLSGLYARDSGRHVPLIAG